MGITDQFTTGNPTNIDRLVCPWIIDESRSPGDCYRRLILGPVGCRRRNFGNGWLIGDLGWLGIGSFGLGRSSGITTFLVPHSLALGCRFGISLLLGSKNSRRHRNISRINGCLLATISRRKRSTTHEKVTHGKQAADFLDGNHRFKYQLGLGILGSGELTPESSR